MLDLTMLIGTCDKYQFLWPKFLKLYEKYWDDTIIINRYVLCETIPFNYDGFLSVLSGKIEYTDRLKCAIDKINTKYVLWLQDDYFFRKKIHYNKFKYYIDYINKYKIDRFGIHHDTCLYTKNHIVDDIYRLDQYSQYTMSMQASIWNTEFFKSCLKHDQPENIWQFEIRGSKRLNNAYIHNIVFEKQTDYWYQEAMKKGKFTQDYYRIVEQENLDLI
jgi:hypothetical protein